MKNKLKRCISNIIIVCVLFTSINVHGSTISENTSETEMDINVEQETLGADLDVSGNTLSDNTVSDNSAIRILFVGNSFTRNQSLGIGFSVEDQLLDIAKQTGVNLEVDTIAFGSAKLKYYAGMDVSHITYYETLMSTLKSKDYDYVILQEQSKTPIYNYNDEMLPAAKTLQQIISIMQPKAKILLYMTHGYNYINQENINKDLITAKNMEQKVAGAYTCLGDQLGIEVIPVGIQFQRSEQFLPELNLLWMDSKHPSREGYFIAACCFYQKIVGDVPILDVKRLKYSILTQQQQSVISILVRETMTSTIKEDTVLIGEKIKMNVTGTPSISSVTFHAIDESIATVNKRTGLIKAMSKGTTVIVAQASDGRQAFCTIHVKTPIKFAREYYLASVGETIRILPGIETEKLLWKSSKRYIANVGVDGTVYPKKGGVTYIKAINADDRNDFDRYKLYVAFEEPKKVIAKLSKKQVGNNNKIAVRISWKKVNGAEKYLIYRANTKKGKYKLLAKSKTVEYIDSTAVQDNEYFYKVVASNGVNFCDSEMSAASKFSSKVVKGLKIKNSGKKAVKLSWKRNKKVNGYMVFRATAYNGNYDRIAVLSKKWQNSFVDRKRKVGKTYYYKVIAY